LVRLGKSRYMWPKGKSARAAALLDPEGEAVSKCLAGLARPAVHAIAAE
jgi:hypothetical protein